MIFRTLFGSPKCKEPIVTFSEDFIQIDAIDFWGFYTKSESKEWAICWKDSDSETRTGGYRESGHGRYVLYNCAENKVVLEGVVERPNALHVANTGHFSVEDWLFGSGLKGVFYVFSPEGNAIIKKRLKSNIYNSGLSSNGKLAVCQTANNPKSEDGNTLSAFDVEKGMELFSIHPATSWAESYEFSEDNQYVIVVMQGIGKFRYDRQGNFLDADNFLKARLNCQDYSQILLAVEDEVARLSTDNAQTFWEAVSRARALGADKDTSWKAVALKLQGIISEQMGNSEEAIKSYQEALKLNPKIGIKRRLDSLLKAC